jgi:hypothetical protein
MDWTVQLSYDLAALFSEPFRKPNSMNVEFAAHAYDRAALGQSITVAVSCKPAQLGLGKLIGMLLGEIIQQRKVRQGVWSGSHAFCVHIKPVELLRGLN